MKVFENPGAATPACPARIVGREFACSGRLRFESFLCVTGLSGFSFLKVFIKSIRNTIRVNQIREKQEKGCHYHLIIAPPGGFSNKYYLIITRPAQFRVIMV